MHNATQYKYNTIQANMVAEVVKHFKPTGDISLHEEELDEIGDGYWARLKSKEKTMPRDEGVEEE